MGFRSVATVLVALGACGVGTAAAAPPLEIELNKLEQAGAGCRFYLVISSRDAPTLESLSLDLALFDTAGIVDRRIVLDLGRIPAGRRLLRAVVIPDLDCDRVGQVLYNGAPSCDAGSAPFDCDTALGLSHRGRVPLTKTP